MVSKTLQLRNSGALATFRRPPDLNTLLRLCVHLRLYSSSILPHFICPAGDAPIALRPTPPTPFEPSRTQSATIRGYV